MSWQERDYSDDPSRSMGSAGGDWRGLRPTIDNPMSWSFSIGRISRIDVRVHILLVVFFAIMLLRSLATSGASIGFTLMAIALAGLFIIVLLHEFGHCFACRWVGGEANEILMWPLGGLAFTMPPHHWNAHLITVIGGPAVNVAIFAVLAPVLGVLTGYWWGVAIPNPLDLTYGLRELPYGSWFLYTLYLVQASNFILLLFNLLPVFPLDGGRILQSLLWPRYGYTRATTYAIRAGYVGAVCMLVFGAVTEQWAVVGIAIFGGLSCYIKQQQLKYTDSVLSMESDSYGSGWAETEPDEPPKKDRRSEKIAQREQQEAAEVDRILQKIADTGIDSLSRAERALLKRVTERKRQMG